MTRNFKALGLALIVALAMSAVAASVASAATDTLFTGADPAFVTAEQEAEKGQHIFEVPGEGVSATCSKAHFGGTVQGGEKITQVTVTPKYEGTCSLEPFGSATVDTTGCDYLLTGETVGAHAKVHINCSGSNKIKITGPLGCTISVGTQSPGGGYTIKNETGGNGIKDVTLNITVTNISWTSTFSCGFIGLPSSGNNATYTGTATAKAYEDNNGVTGSQVDLYYEEDK
jgi:hypothetical protein